MDSLLGFCRRVSVAALLAFISSSAFASPGDPLGPAFLLSSDTAQTGGVLAVARNGDGDFVALLAASTGLQLRLFDADGTPRGDNFPVSDVLSSSSGDVDISDNGEIAACWLHSGPDDELGVYARRFAADGSPLGGEVFVGGPEQPLVGTVSRGGCAIAMDAQGNFVVAWSEGHQRHFGSDAACQWGAGLCVYFDDYKVRFRRYTDGGTKALSPRTLARAAEYFVSFFVGISGGSDIRDVDVDMAPDGTFVVAWNIHGSDGIHLLSGTYAQRFSAGGLPGVRHLVALENRSDYSEPSVSIDAAGGFVVAYTLHGSSDPDDLSRTIFARLYPAHGFGMPAFQVNDPELIQSMTSHTAMDAAGNFVVGWRSYSPDDSVSTGYAQRYAAGGGALGINSVADAGASDAWVAMAGNGDFMIAWNDRNTGEAMARLFDGP